MYQDEDILVLLNTRILIAVIDDVRFKIRIIIFYSIISRIHIKNNCDIGENTAVKSLRVA